MKAGMDTRVKTKNLKIIAGKPKDYEIISFPESSYRIEKEDKIKTADIIHLHWVANFLNYPTFFKNIHQPVVWTLHDMNPFMGLFHYEGDRDRNQNFFSAFEKKAIEIKKSAVRSANIHVVCLSEWLMQKSKSSEILGKFPHYLIPNGMNQEDHTLMDRSVAREKAGIVNDHPAILFVAQNLQNYRKGFDIFYDALLQLKETPFHVIAVGGEIAGLPENISVHSFKDITSQQELNVLYAAADLFVLPSREDNLPNVMLESFANGTPVLSLDTGGMKDWVVEGENGILVPGFESGSLLQGIRNFVAGKYTFNREAIMSFFYKEFNEDLQADRYIELYKSIL